VLQIIYFDNIVRYVRQGGAVLVAAGRDYASPTSLWRTPLVSVLPAEPNGQNHRGRPIGRASPSWASATPVTRGLEGSAEDPPHWSHWFRLVDARAEKGTHR